MNAAVRRIVAAGVVGASALGAAAQQGGGERWALVCDAVVMPDGTLASGRAVMVAGGKVESVAAAADVPAGVRIVRREGMVACPGLVDGFGMLGSLARNQERTSAIDPAVSALEGFDEASPYLGRALAEGVTAAVIAPAPSNPVSGRMAVVKTWHADDRTGSVVVEQGPLLTSFGTAAFNLERGPTSRAGALALLRDVAAGGGGAVLAEAIAGGAGVYAYCSDDEDVWTAAAFFGERGIAPVIVNSESAAKSAADLADGGVAGVIVGPYGAGDEPWELEGAGALDRHGVAVAFAGGAPVADPSLLRRTAALATRYGMDAAAARRAMTVEPARFAGAGGRIGSLAAGMDADIVVFTADPLRPDARVVEVYVGGRLAHSAAGAAGTDLEDVYVGGGDGSH